MTNLNRLKLIIILYIFKKNNLKKTFENGKF